MLLGGVLDRDFRPTNSFKVGLVFFEACQTALVWTPSDFCVLKFQCFSGALLRDQQDTWYNRCLNRMSI